MPQTEMDLIERCQDYLASKEAEAVEVRATALRELATIRLRRLLQEEDSSGRVFDCAA